MQRALETVFNCGWLRWLSAPSHYHARCSLTYVIMVESSSIMSS